ncbi:MAG: heavy metal translocating P-type ATPase, partial [Halobacteriaceae archaeon]
MAQARTQFNVGGMSCSFCAQSIQKAYDRRDGVEDVDVSLAHEEVLVRYDDDELSEVELRDTLRDLGYTIRDPDKQRRFEEQREELRTGRHRLLLAGVLAITAAGLMAWMVFVRGRFESQSTLMNASLFALALATMFGPGRYIKAKAYNSIRRRIFNQHVLLEGGAFAGLVGGVLGLFVFQDFPTVHFFAVSVFITTYHVLSEYTSLHVRTRASRAVQDLLDLQPDTARRVTDDGVEEVAVNDLEEGDLIRIKPGESVPTDGVVVEGTSTVDASVATGESLPEEKSPGDSVIGGSINQSGTLLVDVTATGDDAFLNQVAREIEEARAMKPDIIQLADRVLRYFVPAVLIVALLSLLFWLIVPTVSSGPSLGRGPQVQTGVFASLAVLVLGYPCALGMATPLALMRGGGKAARHGILMRSGDAFQIFPDVDTIVLDKTGTLTVGEPTVVEMVPIKGDEVTLLKLAGSAEAFSEHPIADAILETANDRGIELVDPGEFDSI